MSNAYGVLFVHLMSEFVMDFSGNVFLNSTGRAEENKINISDLDSQIYFLNIADFTYKLIKN